MKIVRPLLAALSVNGLRYLSAIHCLPIQPLDIEHIPEMLSNVAFQLGIILAHTSPISSIVIFCAVSKSNLNTDIFNFNGVICYHAN